MPKIFISYRRHDVSHAALNLKDRLERKFGNDSVFLDFANTPIGVDLREHIERAVQQCDVMLVLIGKAWLALTPGSERNRLFDPEDFVRMEIEAALRHRIPVIPVLLDGAEMPHRMDLPESIQHLIYLNAAELRVGLDLDAHIIRLSESLEPLIKGKKAPAAPRASDIRDMIVKSFADLPKTFVGSRIPEDRLANAIASYAPGVDPSDVVALYDATVWGDSGRTGFLLTADGMFWRGLSGPDHVSYRALEHPVGCRTEADGSVSSIQPSKTKEVDFLRTEVAKALLGFLSALASTES